MLSGHKGWLFSHVPGAGGREPPEEAREPGGRCGKVPRERERRGHPERPRKRETHRARARARQEDKDRGGGSETKGGPESRAQPGRAEKARAAADMCVVRLQFKREGRGGLTTKVIEKFLAQLPRGSWPRARLGAEPKQTPAAAICLILK